MSSGSDTGFAKALLMAAALVTACLGMDPPVHAAAAAEPIHFQRDQALKGRALYAEKCASCHGPELQGRAGPPLRGEEFQKRWLSGQTKFLDFYTTVQQTMPLGAAGSLNGEDYLMVILYVLSQNGYQPTDDALGPQDLRKALVTPDNTTPAMLEDPVEPATPFPQAPAVFGSASSDRPGDDEIAHPDPEQWLMYNKDFTGQRYSQLDRVDAGNAASLVPVCIFQPGEIGAFQTAPVVYDGTMYITTPYNTFAIDATNCRKLWEHRYPAGKAAPWTVNRGVALYRGKIFRVTPNGHLIALDAKTGKLLWDVWMVSNHHGYWLSAAPVAYRGLVYMGTAGADWGANGFIEAFDSETGKLRWKFDVIPTGKETGAETWGKGSATGGGAFWSTFAIDTGTDQLLVPVGNPAPAFRDDLRPGDNLFTDSVVALDLRSGKLAWWAQQVPHDTHDWDTAASPTLYSADGRDMMAVANKGGWLYLYDRRTQALVSKLEISPHENVDVPLTRQGVHHCPGTLGGAEWNGAAYSPDARTLFVNSVHWCSTTQVFDDQYIEGSSYFDGVPALDPVGEAKGFLRAVDAGTGKELWVRKFDNPMVAAVTPTAGGVLFTGSLDGNFLVLDSRDGKTLYHFDTGGAIAGAPSTYLVKDRQYVAVPSGNSSRVVWQTGGAMMLAIFALHEQAPGK